VTRNSPPGSYVVLLWVMYINSSCWI